jgi:sulfoxide reductase heme-binding subunit YedZ
MVKPRFTTLQIAVHLAAWGLLAWLVWDAITGNLTINPIQAATQRTGKYALVFLVSSLACTPLHTLFGFRQVLKARRALGLYAFMFAAIHFAIFVWLDYGFDWVLLQEAVFEKRFVLVGLTALSILLALAFTSFKYWMKRMGKNWKRLHKLVYLAGGLVIVHYAWAVKGDVLNLQGDIFQPLAFGILVTLLFVMRIPAVRRGITRVRGRISQQSTRAALRKQSLKRSDGAGKVSEQEQRA